MKIFYPKIGKLIGSYIHAFNNEEHFFTEKSQADEKILRTTTLNRANCHSTVKSLVRETGRESSGQLLGLQQLEPSTFWDRVTQACVLSIYEESWFRSTAQQRP